MNRREILSIVLGSVLILGVVGGGFTAAAAATASDGSADASASNLAVVQDEDSEENETDEGGEDAETEMDGQENETDGQETDRIPITEAMEAAQSETEDRNGTVVGAELGQEDGGLLDFDNGGDSVYTVDVLLANGTHIEVAVNATNGSVVDTGEQEEGFLEGIFSEDQVPQQPLNLSAMHNATEAVELAQNETGENGTVTSVSLNQRDDNLVYEVQIDSGDDGETSVVVDAMKDGQGVIEVDGEQMDDGKMSDDSNGTAGNDGGMDEDDETGDDEGGMDDGNETDEGDGDGM